MAPRSKPTGAIATFTGFEARKPGARGAARAGAMTTRMMTLERIPTRIRRRAWTDVRPVVARIGSRGKPRQRVKSDGAREGDDDAWDASVERDARALKTFDLTSAFGPCVGLTRVERWDRAASLGLDPPKVVLEILQRRPTTTAWRECVWHGRL